MDIYAAVKRQHDATRKVIEPLSDTTPGAEKTRQELFGSLKRDLWSHNKVEEAVFYSVFKYHQDIRGEALEAFAEHHVLNSLLEESDTTPVTSDDCSAKFSALQELLEHHMNEEEDEVFDMAQEILSGQQASDMGRKFESRHRVIVAALTPIAAQ